MDTNGFRAEQKAVRSLIAEARRYVSIRHVCLDRGFYQVHVVAELARLDVVIHRPCAAEYGDERPSQRRR